MSGQHKALATIQISESAADKEGAFTRLILPIPGNSHQSMWYAPTSFFANCSK